GKLKGRLRGPYAVMAVLPHLLIQIQSIVDETVVKVHIRRLQEVKGAHTVGELQQIASEEDEEYVVEEIVNHRLDEDGEHEFEVKWAGFEVEENSWETFETV
ncbi:hypothetical protein ADUPG1_005791, partial [Aduncisulcus paluster]